MSTEVDWRRYRPLALTPILTGALAAFREHGYHGTTVRDVARRVGVTVPTLYYHHENKQGLLLALLDVAMDDLLAHAHAALAAAGPHPEERLTGLLEAVALHVTRRADLASLDSELRYLEPESRAHYSARRAEVQRLLTEILREGTARGVFHVEHLDDTARALLGMYLAIPGWYRADGSLSPEEIAARYRHIALRAVGARRTPRRK